MVAVRDGFCLPAFVFSIFWMLFRKLWFQVLAWAYWIFLAVFLYLDFEQKLSTAPHIYIFAGLLFLVFFLLPGISGNRWVQARIRRQGFELVEAVEARSQSEAVQAVSSRRMKWTVPEWTAPGLDEEDGEQLVKPAALTVQKPSRSFLDIRAWTVIVLCITGGVVLMFAGWPGTQEKESAKEQAARQDRGTQAAKSPSPGTEQKQKLSAPADHDPGPEHAGAGQAVSGQQESASGKKQEIAGADKDFMSQCERDIAAQTWDRAVDSCGRAARAEPDDPEIWNKLGRAYVQVGEEKQAENAYNHAVQVEPDNVRAWSGMAKLSMHQGQSEQAVQALTEVIRLEPENMTARSDLAREYVRAGQGSRAVDVWQQADALQPGAGIEGLKFIADAEPDNDRAWQELGKAYGNVQDWSSAADAFQQAVRIDPDQAEVWEDLGQARMKLGHHQQAISAYDAATAIDPGLAESWYGKGRAWLDNENGSDRPPGIRSGRVYGFFHEHLDVWHGFEMTGADLVPRLEAVRAFSRAVSLDPGYAPAWYEMGVFFLSAGDWLKPAIYYLEKAARISPDDVKIWKALARAFYSAGKPGQEIDALVNILNIEPDKMNNWQALIDAYADQGRQDEVRELTLEMEKYFAGGS